MLSNICREWTIKADGILSLVWNGDHLVDWAGGGRRYGLDGAVGNRLVSYGYKFDAATVSPSGRYVLIYTSIGTKGLLLRNGEVIRQLNRDCYYAEAYLYPATFALLDDGREVLIHCPEYYCQIEIEDVETGECLTSASERKSDDIFHSRLSVSPNGRWLMSAGWVWHPLGLVQIYDLHQALQDPSTLDNGGLTPPGSWELSAATFLNDDSVVVGTSDEFFGYGDNESDNQPGANHLAAWKIGGPKYSTHCAVNHPLGSIMAVTDRYVVSLYEHPQLIDLKNGKVVHEWSDIKSGNQTGSITWDNTPPPTAIDTQNRRFAVAQENEIRIVQINASALQD